MGVKHDMQILMQNIGTVGNDCCLVPHRDFLKGVGTAHQLLSNQLTRSSRLLVD